MASAGGLQATLYSNEPGILSQVTKAAFAVVHDTDKSVGDVHKLPVAGVVKLLIADQAVQLPSHSARTCH